MKRNNHTCTKSPNRTTTNLLKMLRNGVFSHWNQHVTKMVRCMMHAKRDHGNPMVKTTILCQGLNLHKNSLPSFATKGEAWHDNKVTITVKETLGICPLDSFNEHDFLFISHQRVFFNHWNVKLTISGEYPCPMRIWIGRC